jgi:hypothetical protein
MPERKKVKEYRETLHKMAKPQKGKQRKELEGKSAKLGIELYGEERKGRPDVKLKGKPRR